MNVKIGDYLVGKGQDCFIIAEIGMNHNGDIELGKKIILAAKESGCHAVKFQMFTAEKLVVSNAKTYGNEKGHLPKFQQEMYKKYELTKQQYIELKNYCHQLGLSFFASVWDEENADLLEEIGGDCFKIGSADITHLPLLKHIAKKGKPIIMSTGMATINEINEAIETIKEERNNQIILLHCISGYPTKIEDSNLKFISTLKKKYAYPIGFSDHTPGHFSSVGAISLGANVIEKHFTINKNLPGVDHHLSMNPVDMESMVKNIDLMQKTLGSGNFTLTESEKETRKMARRSIVAKNDILKGTMITKEMLVIKRPGTGLSPKFLDKIIGKVATNDLKKDEVIDISSFEFLKKKQKTDQISKSLDDSSTDVSCFLCEYSPCNLGHYIEKDKLTKKPVQFYYCNNCNVEFVYPQGIDEINEIEKIYERGTGEGLGIKKKILLKIPYSSRHKEVFKFLEELNVGTMLDVGCREGKLSWLMNKRGWKTFGVEPTPFYVDFAKKNYGLNVVNAFLQDIKTDQKFNLIVLSAILEHVPDQINFLKLASSFLEKNGRIFVRVPHHNSNWHAATHLFIHTEKSINYCFKEAGLYITKMLVVGREFFILGGLK